MSAKTKKPRVFLGGTCNESTWRDELIPELEIDYFNPVVKDWKPEDQARELEERATCDYLLYCLTPKMTGFYSVAEVVDDSNKRPDKTVFFFWEKDGEESFNEAQTKSLKMLVKMLRDNGVKCFLSQTLLLEYLNKKAST
jgi:hypothetical protein